MRLRATTDSLALLTPVFLMVGPVLHNLILVIQVNSLIHSPALDLHGNFPPTCTVRSRGRIHPPYRRINEESFKPFSFGDIFWRFIVNRDLILPKKRVLFICAACWD